MTLIERQKSDRRFDLPVEFPLTDSEGAYVTQDRRQSFDRRNGNYGVDELVEKVCYLKRAVYETPLQHALNKHDSVVISRVLHEISIEDLSFLLECTGNLVSFSSIDRFADAERTIGLMNLGLLSRSAAEGTARSVAGYHFTTLADRLVKLLAK